MTRMCPPMATPASLSDPGSSLHDAQCSRPSMPLKPTLLSKFEMNTTSTAQYAALAANNSCRFASVKRLIAAEKSRVKTTRIPTASNVESRSPIDVSLYKATTGSTRSTNMINVMIRPTSFWMRD